MIRVIKKPITHTDTFGTLRIGETAIITDEQYKGNLVMRVGQNLVVSLDAYQNEDAYGKDYSWLVDSSTIDVKVKKVHIEIKIIDTIM